MSESSMPPPRPSFEPGPSRPRASLPVIASALVLALAILVLVRVAMEEEAPSPSAGPVSPTLGVQAPARSELLAVGEQVPPFTAPELNGGRISWEDYAGRPAVLVVWAPWCPHCQAELPVLAAVTSGFPAVRLVSVVTAIDPASGPTPRRYMRSNGLRFPVAVDDASGTLANAFGIRAFPTIFFVGADGMVRAVHEGEMSATELRTAIGGL